MKLMLKSNKKTVALLAIAAAILMVLTVLAVTMDGTIAATEDTHIVLKCESGIPAQYTVEVGQILNLTIGGLNEAFSSDTGIVTVAKTSEKLSNLEMTGKRAGVAAIAYGTDIGYITVVRYQVTDSRNVSVYTIKDGGTVRLNNPGDSKPIPVEVVTGTDNIKWHSLNETVASVDANTGLVIAAKKGVTILVGEFTDKWGVDRDIHILVGVGVSLDGIDDNTGGGNTDLIGPDGNGNYYKPTGNPPNVYEVVDKDGNSNQPPEFIYNPDGDPTNGNNNPAQPGGGDYFVEDPKDSNIWKPVDKNGNINDHNTVWGGENGRPGGGDDKPINMFNGEWWVDMGQNVWKKYIDKTTLGPLTGGGFDRDPATFSVNEIFDNTANDGKYYVGPINPGADEYYYGDPFYGNGYLESAADMNYGDDVKYYKDANGNMTTTKPSKPIIATGAESVVDGRILDDDQTGDGIWIEIARNGDYSLIIRKEFIKCYKDQNQTDYWIWYAPMVNGSNYGEPNNFLRQELNKWFNMEINGNADGRQVLAKNAKLRNYTVQNNAYSVLGSSGKYPASLIEGFSKPAAYQTGEGNDIAFALSWSEAASFCSITSRYRDIEDTVIFSDPIAAANYGKLSNLYTIYLRSTGDTTDTMATLYGGGSDSRGQVFQNNKAYIHPALWVHQDIFE